MPKLQTREGKIIVALGAITRSSGFKLNFKTDELEPYVELQGDLGGIVNVIIKALDE